MLSTIKRRKLRATNMLMHLEIISQDNGKSGKWGGISSACDSASLLFEGYMLSDI
jgi:hypothetical protein